jgi:putative phosphonate metabolism protein
MFPRYAVFFAPPSDSLLWELGCRWLGRDARSGGALAQPQPPAASAASVSEATAAPRLYGFHGTLKPPFALRPGTGVDALHAELTAFAARRQRFALPPLEVAMLSGFLALRPTGASDTLDALARECVTQLDHLRAPALPAELSRRRAAGLSERQEALLVRYGYPYVLDEYRFHLTLTDRLPAEDVRPLREWLAEFFRPALARHTSVDGICLFCQAHPGATFRLERRYEFLANRGP